MRLPRLFALAAFALMILAAPAGARDRSMFVSQQIGSVGMSWFSMDVETGALTQHAGVTASGLPTVPGITPDGKYLYVGDFNGDALGGFAIGSGGLTALSGFPISGPDGPNAAVVDPTGSHVWTADYEGDAASGFAIAAGGSGSALPGFPVALGAGPTTIAVTPRNDFVYTPASNADLISGFRRGADGSLTPLAGFPLGHGGWPIDIEFSVDGKFLYVANNTADSISGYAIDQQSGALTEVPGSPFPTGDLPVGLAASSRGGLLFSANGGGTIDSFAIAGDGSLTPVDEQPAGSSPNDVEVSPDGRFIYTANFWSGNISGFSISANGTLAELSGSPFGDGTTAIGSFAIVPNQGPAAAFSSAVSGSSASFNGGASTDPDGSVATYAWDFGDGGSGSGVAPAHTYAAPGTYTVTLQVTDDENCSNLQIGTGQVFSCNGSPAAIVSRAITIPAARPLTLRFASAKQVKSKGSSKRIRVRFQLSAAASVTYQFQKSKKNGACRRHTTKHAHKPSFKNFGKKITKPGVVYVNNRTFTNKVGGKKIVVGRYRVRLKAESADGQQTGTVTTASFCVR